MKQRGIRERIIDLGDITLVHVFYSSLSNFTSFNLWISPVFLFGYLIPVYMIPVFQLVAFGEQELACSFKSHLL